MNQYTATSTTDDDAKPTPDPVGTLPNATEEIPQIVSQSMSHPNTVGTVLIAWTTLDAQWETYLCRASCCMTFGRLIVVPCCWPIVLACLPLGFCVQSITKQELRNTYWILTNQEVIIVIEMYHRNRQNAIQHIPLRNITECFIRTSCYDQLPALCIQIIDAKVDSDGIVESPKEGFGLAGHDWFHTAILRQRDQMASRLCSSTEDDLERKCVEEKSAGVTPRQHVCVSNAADEAEGKRQEFVLATSNEQCPENLPPETIGTISNLPQDVRSMVCWGLSTVVAWSKLDPEFEPVLFRIKWCYWVVLGLYGIFLFHATDVLIGSILLFVILFFFFQVPVVWQQGLRNTYWILTDRDLILVTQRHWLFSDKIQYISLDHIVNCGTVRSCCSRSTIYVDTPFSMRRKGQHYVSFFALAESDWFKTAILQQRDQFLACFPMQDCQEGPLPELHHNVV
jgi:hypothetical protein